LEIYIPSQPRDIGIMIRCSGLNTFYAEVLWMLSSQTSYSAVFVHLLSSLILLCSELPSSNCIFFYKTQISVLFIRK